MCFDELSLEVSLCHIVHLSNDFMSKGMPEKNMEMYLPNGLVISSSSTFIANVIRINVKNLTHKNRLNLYGH